MIAVVVLGVWRPWSPVPATPPIGAGGGHDRPAPLALPQQPRVLVFGDSWTFCSTATPRTDGYAYALADLLDAETLVEGVSGSDYLDPGVDGLTYGERVAMLDATLNPDLVIIQGSINDRGRSAAGYQEAVDAAWDTLAVTYPETPIVVLGPAPQERGWWYVSPIAKDWITEDNYLAVTDVDLGRKHPSTAGHRYLAEKLAAALGVLSVTPVSEPESESTPGQ